MSQLDWTVLIASLVFIVVYGIYKGRRSKNIEGYLLADRQMKWYTILLSIMATQASAITFLSAPGQAYADGVRFVQFYLGLPLAMIVLSITAVPIYHRLKVYTAYEYLENRFDLKTRGLAALLFLIQRGLAAGLTIYAPAIILSVILGWNIFWTNLIIGLLVVSYTAYGGTKAVNWTHFQQMLIIFFGMAAAFFMVIHLLPPDISFGDALHIAGKMGKLNAIDFKFDLNNRYNFWSGILGGFFLQLSYFGTDQSQVQRYLTGKSVAQSRLALLLNGMAKIPMQFLILLLGAMVFVFYQFTIPPIFFNTVETQHIRQTEAAAEFAGLEKDYRTAFEQKQANIRQMLAAMKSGDGQSLQKSQKLLQASQSQAEKIKQRAVQLLVEQSPDIDPHDTNYIFLNFVTRYLPAGLVGLIIAAILAASMSSTAAELNALASTTVVDIYRRLVNKTASPQKYVWVSRLATLAWGGYAILLAQYASRLGSLIEAVNILGSLFYGTILGIFLVAFYLKKIGGTATFLGAILAEIVVVAFFMFSGISFLWYNLIGCAGVVIFAAILNLFLPVKSEPAIR